ncbi:MAG TPA: response regulator transcription factor [Actinobacteria bacterium]|nr:response regulator transcription factor [Actinomycetota bacterium]
MDKIRVVVVDDHALMRDGIKKALERNSDIHVVGEASTGEKAIKLIDSLETDLVLLDLRLPDIDGISVLKKLLVSFPFLKVIILSVFEDENHVKSALKNGASGYLTKSIGPRKLIEAVRRAANGQSPFSLEATTSLVSFFRHSDCESSLRKLTSRESEVWQLISLGASNAEICEKLFISQGTVKFHIRNIFHKLGVKNRVEAASLAHRHELFESEVLH